MQESLLKQSSSQTDGAYACPLFFCDLPLHNAVLLRLSLLHDSWQSLTVMAEVLRSHFRLSPPPGKGSVISFEKVCVQCSSLDVLLCVPGFEPVFLSFQLIQVLFSTHHLLKNRDLQFEWTLSRFFTAFMFT